MQKLNYFSSIKYFAKLNNPNSMSEIYLNNSVYFGQNAFDQLNHVIENDVFSSVVVLMDTNTKFHCLPILKHKLSTDFKTICIDPGEGFKNIHTCLFIWEQLSKTGADRNALLISLGGGVVTDIGGFAASCFKRGIAFVHLPTTLLGMVDAAIGGKNGVDLNTLKNQIGIIRRPHMIGIDSQFLKTLPKQQIVSGYAEMIKHGLIHSDSYFDSCISTDELKGEYIEHLITESVSIKLNIVEEDINEKGLRKALNYGHTLGHAIESFRMSFDKSRQLLHGEAIAIGLVLETFISHRLFKFPKYRLDQLKTYIHNQYSFHRFDKSEQLHIIDLMKHDKKNTKGNINFVLLKNIGNPLLNCKVENDLIHEAFDYYQDR